MLYTSKESSEHAKCRFRWKKYDLLLKKWKNLILKKKNSKGGPFDVRMVHNFFFRFSKFQKWLQLDVANVERNKLMKFEPWSTLQIAAVKVQWKCSGIAALCFGLQSSTVHDFSLHTIAGKKCNYRSN